MTDLFGADLPVEGGKGGEFAWRDGPFLKVLKSGHWIVLDEVKVSKQISHYSEFQIHSATIFLPLDFFFQDSALSEIDCSRLEKYLLTEFKV